ncbi:MAG: hypothetical protein JJE55_08325 [Flavobacteriaceae bacterium]|nr:hypothetical protein [Flavobacteriaceae bacterium]
MGNLFNIDWEKFVTENLLVALRRTLLIHVLLSAINEVKALHTTFLAAGNDWIYKIKHTAQVIHIEKVLNDYFDDVERRIYINNVQFEAYKFLYPDGEDPHFLQEVGADPDSPMYLLDEFAGQLSPDATVYIPIAMKPLVAIELENFENEVRGKVDYYKTWGVNYQIVYYE